MEDAEWITLQEAADMLGVDRYDLAGEINFSQTAVVITGAKGLGARAAEVAQAGGVPVKQIPCFDYMFVAVRGGGQVVHPISHIYREALLPWAARRAAALLQSPARWWCSVHGYVRDESVLWTGSHQTRSAKTPICGMSPTKTTVCATPLTAARAAPGTAIPGP